MKHLICFVIAVGCCYVSTIRVDAQTSSAQQQTREGAKPKTTCLEEGEIQAVVHYMIGVDYWHCAYNLSSQYSDRNKLTDDPFHARNFSNEPDKLEFNNCVTKGIEYIEKALAIKPEFYEAIAYKSLLLREKQKATSVEAERKRLEQEAIKLVDLANELEKRVPSISGKVSVAPPPPPPAPKKINR
jgi:hypothetical protein